MGGVARACNSAVERSIAARMVTSSIPVSRLLIFFRLATELYFTPVSLRPFTQYDPGPQLTPPVAVLERLETFQQSCKP